MSHERQFEAVGFVCVLQEYREGDLALFVEHPALDVGIGVTGRPTGSIVDDHAAIADCDRHQRQCLLAGVIHRHEHRRAGGVRHP